MTARRTTPTALRAVPVAEPVVYGIRVDGVLKLALTAHEVAELTSMTIREVWGAVERGQLRNSGHGRRLRITGQDLLTYLGLLPGAEDRKTA